MTFPIVPMALTSSALVGLQLYRRTNLWKKSGTVTLGVRRPRRAERWLRDKQVQVAGEQGWVERDLPSRGKFKSHAKMLRQQLLLPILRPFHRQQRLALGEAVVIEPLSAEEEEAAIHLLVSLSSLTALSLARVLYPPFALLGLSGLLYTLWPYMRNGYHSLFHRRELKIGAIDLLLMPGLLLSGQWLATALMLTLLNASRIWMLNTEERAKQKLANIFGPQATMVWLVDNGVEVEIPLAQVQQGALLVVSAGQVLPVDGVITAGAGALDERMLTGEAQPTEKGVGDAVFAATILLAGRLIVCVKETGDQTIAARIRKVLLQTADARSAVQAKGEALADQYVPITLLLAALALPWAGAEGALVVLLSGLAYYMRVLAPLSMLNFLQITARRGILIKDARSFELLQSIDTIVFDKTGTLTLDQLHVCRIYPWHGGQDEEVLRYAATAERRQTHPIARAILQAAHERSLVLPAIGEGRYTVGFGIQALIDGCLVRVGSTRFLAAEGITVPPAVQTQQTAAQAQGHSMVMVAVNEELIGLIELAPTLRPEARHLVEQLHKRQLQLHIISGDHEAPTRHLAHQLGIDHYFANTLPEQKAALVAQLQTAGRRVCFVGDGINDAIALKQANVSISLRGASTIATDTAQIVLTDATLQELEQVFVLAKAFDANMRANLWTTLVPGYICIGGVFFFGMGLYPAIMLANLAMLVGVGNAMLPLLTVQPQRQ